VKDDDESDSSFSDVTEDSGKSYTQHAGVKVSARALRAHHEKVRMKNAAKTSKK
jgi:hypothetical protein